MSDAGGTGARRDAAPSGALLTPTKINAWLECPHYFTLMRDVEAGRATLPPPAVGSFARLLQRKGDEHEAAVEAVFRDSGLGVRRVDSKERGETFADWVDRTAFMLGAEVDMLAQMPLAHEGIRGVADFLERTTDPETGRAHWAPIDAKLARREAKPGHVLQLCVYADALAAAVGEAPERLRISLGSGVVESIGFEDVRPYWARLRERLASAAAAGPETATRPEPCDHCAFCEFQPICEGVWRDEDSLVYVAGIRAAERRALEAAGVVTMAALADRASPVDDLGDERRERLRTQARLQVLARETPDKPPPFDLNRPASIRSGEGASNGSPSPTTETSSSTSRATPSGAPTADSSSSSAASPATTTGLGDTARPGRTTRPRRASRFSSSSVSSASAGRRAPRCMCTTTTTPSDRRWSRWRPSAGRRSRRSPRSSRRACSSISCPSSATPCKRASSPTPSRTSRP